MSSTYYNMTDATGNRGFLPTITFTSTNNTFTSTQRIAQLASYGYGVTGYYEADFASNITTIASSAFSGDTKVVVVTINQVITIGASAFDGCTALRAITLDTAVDGTGRYKLTSIGNYAFKNCSSLYNLHIPDTVKVIPPGMCQGCTGLEVAVMGYGVPTRKSGSNYIYNADATIGEDSFNNCSSLTYFVVPETVYDISGRAFANCTAMSYFAILGRPTVSSTAFTGAKGSGATYIYDISRSTAIVSGGKREVDLSLNTVTAASDLSSSNTLPPGHTPQNYRTYGLEPASGTTLTFTDVKTAIPASPTWWKGIIASSVTAVGDSAFTPILITSTRYEKMIGIQMNTIIATLGYEAFGNYNNPFPTSTCYVAAFYLPNSITSLSLNATATTANADTHKYTFNLTNSTSRDASATKQIVFQSGINSCALPGSAFLYNSAKAIILPKITTVTFAVNDVRSTILPNCLLGTKYLQLLNIFQKNAYTNITYLGPDFQYVFQYAFSGRLGKTHYLYIPKQITHIGSTAFFNITDQLLITLYNNYNETVSAGLGYGYLSYTTTNDVNFRFSGTRPVIHRIYNNYDSGGTTRPANDTNGITYHLLFPPGVKIVTPAFQGWWNVISVAFHHDASPNVVLQHTNTAGRGNVGGMTGTFQNCANLEFVYLNNRVTIMEPNAFRNTKLNEDFDLIDAAPLKEMYHAVFFTDVDYTCNVRQITVPNTVKLMTSAVFGCGSLGRKPYFTKFSLANDIEFWGDYAYATISPYTVTASYYYNDPANYMTITNAFCLNCDFLQSVSFLDTVDENGADITTEFNGALVRPNPYLPITIRKNKQTLNMGLKRIMNSTFSTNFRLQSIRIPDGVTHIGSTAFFDNYSVSYLYLPDTLTFIGVDAFSWMNISNKFGAPGNDIYVRAPANLIDSINNTNFQNSTQLNTYYVTVFFNKSSNKVTNGVLGRFTTQNPTRIYYNVVIEDGIHSILGGGGLQRLITVTISDTVTNIQNDAFSGSTSLHTVRISPTSSISSFGSGAFFSCTALTTFFIPNSLIYLGDYAFNNCLQLSSVTFGDNPGLKYIGNQAFVNSMTSLTRIHIPASVIYIGRTAFINYYTTTSFNNLTTVTFGAGSRLKSISGSCFGSYVGWNDSQPARYLQNLVLPSSVQYMATPSAGTSILDTTADVLRSTHTLAHSANLVMPSSLQCLSWAIFHDTGSFDVSNVYLPISLNPNPGPRRHNGYRENSKGGEEFSASKSGSLLYSPSGFVLQNTGTGRTYSYYKTVAYSGSTLTTLSLPIGVTNIADSTNTTQVHAAIQEGVIVIGDGTSSIAGSYAIQRSNLISVNIPSTVTTISQKAFNGCGALVYVTFSENSHLTTIGTSAFQDCSMIHDIQLPNSLTTIGTNAFNGCTNLATISIPYNVTGLGSGAFQNTGFRLVPNAYKVCTDITADTGSFGEQMALSKDGNYVVASAPGYGTGLVNQPPVQIGYVRVYEIIGSSWIQRGAQAIGSGNYQYVGYSVAINGNGTIYAYSMLPDSSVPRVVISRYQNGNWVQLGSNLIGTPVDYFGTRMSLSDDGYTIAIGAWNTGSGGGYVQIYSYNFTTSQWVQVGNTLRGEKASDYSGGFVSLSADGTTVAIGANGNDGTNASTTDERGHARIYKYRTVTETNWTNYTVANANGTFIYTNKPIVATGDTNPVVGKYYWVQMGQDIDGTNAADNFGRVSLSDDGQYVAIGAPNNDTNGNNAGQVQVYQYNGTSSWVKLGGDIIGEAANDLFGTSVSLSYYNSRIRVAIGAEAGAGGVRGYTRIFEYDANKTAAITDKNSLDYGPSKWRRLYNDITGMFHNDRLGGMVSISADGNRFAVAARKANNEDTGYGYVQVYNISAAKPPDTPVRIHEHLYNDISGTLSTYFTSPSLISFQVVPELLLTNTLHPSSLTISQINNIYIRYRQSQLGFPKIAVNGSGAGGTLTTTDISNAILASGGGFVHLDISASSIPAIAFLNNLNIYSVAISKTVVTIGASAFNGCSNLTYLSFHPDSVCTTINDTGFHNINIIDLALPDSLTTIGVSAFQSCFSLISVCIPNKVTALGLQAFHNCNKLTSVTVPTGLTNTLTSSYFNTNGSTLPANLVDYNPLLSAIPHFKLSDYSIPTGIIQNVVDSQVKYIDHRAYAYYPEITLYAINIPQTSGPYSYGVNGVNFPIMPAAYLLNGGSITNNSIFPLFRSVPDLNTFSANSTESWPDNGGGGFTSGTDDFYILMPGYSICIYNNLYDEENLFTETPNYGYYDNEFGKVPLNIDSINNAASSILFMYKGCILSKKFTK